jgi:hypothetical protein
MNNKSIKKRLLPFAILCSFQAMALEGSPKKELLMDIKTQTKKCAVQIVSPAVNNDNEKVVGYKSICAQLKIISQTEAQILIDGEWLTAKITESAESDGGDLDDLAITDANDRQLASKTNIAAYDSILVAMAGDTHFRKIHLK